MILIHSCISVAPCSTVITMEVEEEMLVEPTVIEAAAQAAFQDDSEPMDSGDDMATRPSYPALSAAQMAVS